MTTRDSRDMPLSGSIRRSSHDFFAANARWLPARTGVTGFCAADVARRTHGIAHSLGRVAAGTALGGPGFCRRFGELGVRSRNSLRLIRAPGPEPASRSLRLFE